MKQAFSVLLVLGIVLTSFIHANDAIDEVKIVVTKDDGCPHMKDADNLQNTNTSRVIVVTVESKYNIYGKPRTDTNVYELNPGETKWIGCGWGDFPGSGLQRISRKIVGARYK